MKITTPITIVGAGLAGLLAGNMLRRSSRFENVGIIEAQSRLPNNHNSVLRFRSSVVGDVLGIPFQKVKMIKATAPWRNPVADALAYSYKNTGLYRSDRSVNRGLVEEERWIAPPDLIQQMAAEAPPITFGSTFNPQGFSDPVISTMPMPSLMMLLAYPDYEDIDFSYVNGYTIQAKVENCDAYVSLLVPDPKYPFSRVSITGSELFVEVGMTKIDLENLHPNWVHTICNQVHDLLGIKVYTDTAVMKEQRYAKIAPIDERKRKEFMAWATDTFNIYSLGRFATWRPGLLLDDLVRDVRLITHWMEGGRYDVRQHRKGEN